MPAAEAQLRLVRRGLGPTDDQYEALRDWVGEVVSADSRLLDVGAGDGDDSYARLIRPLVREIVGVDPDPGLEGNELLDRAYRTTVEQFAADRPEPPFDAAVAIYVAEHVGDPVSFLSSVASCLRPGGSLFLLTPNLWHYFGLLAKTSLRLGLDDRLLRMVRHSHPGHDHVAHFPVAYRMNSVTALGRSAGRAGFVAGEIRFLENPAVFETYFPPRLAVLPRSYSRLVHRYGLVAAYGTMLCRLVTPPGEAAD
jgi:SAM-dependent methyltransferase